MNEQIKKLMDGAVRFHWDYDGQAYEAQVHPEDLEYFAELIVRECGDYLYKYAEFSDKDVNQFLEHFGVEE